jgi:hypothetical protein
MSPDELANNIVAGDTIHVRCGAIAHTAVVFSADRSRDELLMLDPYFQYWQPTHNSCISSFSLVHYKYGYYFTKLKLSEVQNMLDAVQTLRTYQAPSFVHKVDTADSQLQSALRDISASGAPICAKTVSESKRLIGIPLALALSQDLFTWFNLERVGDQLVENALYIILFAPGSLQFKGDVLIAVRTDSKECTRSMSLFLRRSFLAGQSQMFAKDILRNFIGQVFGADEQKTIFSGKDAQREVPGVLSGDTESTVLRGANLNAFLGNVVDNTGGRWIRVDAWQLAPPTK